MKRGIESDVFEEEKSTNSTGENEEPTSIITDIAFTEKTVASSVCLHVISVSQRGVCVFVCVSDSTLIDHTVSKRAILTVTFGSLTSFKACRENIIFSSIINVNFINLTHL